MGHFGTKLSFLLQTVEELDQIRRKNAPRARGVQAVSWIHNLKTEHQILIYLVGN